MSKSRRSPSPSLEQIRRETSRLLGAKSQAMRDAKALAGLMQPRAKGRQKRKARPAPVGIRMGTP
jgi:hypothetical protein